MKIYINIEKKHVFLILGSILLLGVLGFAYAQGQPVPNHGHSFSQLSGVAPNCDASIVAGNADCAAAVSAGFTNPANFDSRISGSAGSTLPRYRCCKNLV